jgi:hypothetical protein
MTPAALVLVIARLTGIIVIAAVAAIVRRRAAAAEQHIILDGGPRRYVAVALCAFRAAGVADWTAIAALEVVPSTRYASICRRIAERTHGVDR